MLSSFTVRGFKSLSDVTLRLSDVTLLTGWNASGKSNVLEALELLCWTARAPRLSDLSHAIEQRQVRLRGNLRDLAPFGSGAELVSLACEIAADEASSPSISGGRLKGVGLGPLEFEISLRLTARGLQVDEERLRAPWIEARGFRQPFYEATAVRDGYGHAVSVQYQNFRRGTNPTIEAIADQPCFVQLTTPARFPSSYGEARELIPAASRRVRDVLGDVRFLDPAPHAMRGYAFRDDDQLHLDGDNLSAVLWKLVEAGEHDEILAFVAGLPEERIDRLEFLETPRNEVMVVARETFGNRPEEVPAALMSDGTLRVLAIAGALLSAPKGALVVIEEIDNGVHPSRAGALLATILATATRRGIRVLITTHNPALQDALPEQALPDVTLAYRNDVTGRTELARLGDLAAFPRIAAGGSLGRLVTQASFERMVKRTSPTASYDLDWLRQPADGVGDRGAGDE